MRNADLDAVKVMTCAESVTSGRHALSGEHVLDGVQYPLLPLSRQPADFVKYASRFSGGTALVRRSAVSVKQRLDRYAENLRDSLDLIRAQCHRSAFPAGIGCLRDVQLLRNLGLRESTRFARGMEPGAERRPRMFSRSSRVHAVIIRAAIPSYVF